MRTAVIGHTEWIEFGNVEAVPGAGDIVHATDAWEEPGGGGAVAAVQLARLAGSCTFYTAFGGDEHVFVEVAEGMSLEAFFKSLSITNAVKESRIAGVPEICPANS